MRCMDRPLRQNLRTLILTRYRRRPRTCSGGCARARILGNGNAHQKPQYAENYKLGQDRYPP